ncbi:MAG: methyltransferase domain-containing protein [Nocardioidaceae bacterium]
MASPVCGPCPHRHAGRHGRDRPLPAGRATGWSCPNRADRYLREVGCGPGHVAAHLRGLCARVVAVDLSHRMARHARGRGHPGGRGAAYAEVARVLRHGGRAVVAFHTRDAENATGSERRMDEWWDHDIDLTFRFLSPDHELARLAGAGLDQVARPERLPGPGEHPSERGYLVVERPGG